LIVKKEGVWSFRIANLWFGLLVSTGGIARFLSGDARQGPYIREPQWTAL
jgi:hypothetical protein